MKKILFIVSIFLFVTSLSAQVVVIANKSVPDAAITSNKLESVYLLEQDRWSDGSGVVVFDLNNESEIKNSFYGFINKTPKNMKKIWLRAKLSGEGIPPTQVGSEEEMLSQVSSTPGAVGYISKAKVTDAVKVLATIQ